MTGLDQVLLATAIYLHPTADGDEICAYIYNNGGGLYTRDQVYRRLKELGVVRKQSSIEAFAAFTPRNLLKARLFWQMPPPLGIHGILRRQLIDIDETRFALHTVRNKKGWGIKCTRVRDIGEYRRGQLSLNLIIAIEPGNPRIPCDELGSLKHPRRWFKITTRNCDQVMFANFIDGICTDIETSPCVGDEERIFMFDNLAAHTTPLVNHTFELRDQDTYKFLPVPRPPYQPKFGPIEYIIGQIAMKLTEMYESDWTLDSLRMALYDICRTIGNDNVANKTFRFVGYKA